MRRLLFGQTWTLLLLAVLASLSRHGSAFEQKSPLRRPPKTFPSWRDENGSFMMVTLKGRRQPSMSPFLFAGEQGAAACGSGARMMTTTTLSSTQNQSSGEDQKNKNNKNRVQLWIRKWLTWQSQIYRRFQALPKRAKRLVVVQWMALLLCFGAVAQKAYTGSVMPSHRRPPIEISYSKFLDLVEQKKQDVANGALPRMDHVRIGTDRIVYRLYPAATAEDEARSAEATTAAAETKVSAAQESETKTTTKSSQLLSLATAQKQQQQQDNNNKAGAAATTTKESASLSSFRLGRISSRQKASSISATKNKSNKNYVTAYTRKVPASAELVNTLRQHDINFAAASRAKASTLALTVRSIGIAFYFLILWRLYKTVSSAGGGGGNQSDVPGKLAQVRDLPLANFDEIQGIDEVKAEVMELVDTIRNPQKYAMLGARAPTGILLEGPSGTGKTMLARATAATCGIPLIYCSGSDFVEMFVGRGAARVRKLFERAAKLAPCIIFIDELDALGKARDMGVGGLGNFGGGRSNDEAEQTLNQLLACMDGLDSTGRGICVLAATNRRDVLDPALVRPGRFDRIVKVELPNAAGREKILRVHCQKLPGFVEGSGVDPTRLNALGKGRMVDLGAIAAVTNGLSGAELEFIVNEAAIRAVRRVTASLQQPGHVPDVTPHVEAVDFEASVANFFATRKTTSTNSNSGSNLFRNMMKS